MTFYSVSWNTIKEIYLCQFWILSRKMFERYWTDNHLLMSRFSSLTFDIWLKYLHMIKECMLRVCSVKRTVFKLLSGHYLLKLGVVWPLSFDLIISRLIRETSARRLMLPSKGILKFIWSRHWGIKMIKVIYFNHV